ncbi:MAG: hypothetical protein IPP25_07760 [Saprospiraceae bacterium]|nr:hypothetical protein [Candidatus Opimibacter skivensis]
MPTWTRRSSREKEEVTNNLDWNSDSIIIHKMPEWDEAEHSKVEVNPTFLQIVDLKGKVIFHSTNLLHDQFLYGPDIDQDFFFNGELSLQKIRLGQFPIRNDAGKILGHLTIAISRQESYTVLHNLVLVFIIAFPFVLIILFSHPLLLRQGDRTCDAIDQDSIRDYGCYDGHPITPAVAQG